MIRYGVLCKPMMPFRDTEVSLANSRQTLALCRVPV